MATPPSLISSTQILDTTTSPKTTGSIAVQAGDIIEVRGWTGDGAVNLSTPVTSGQTYVLQNSVVVASFSAEYCWTTTAVSSGNITVQLTRSAGTTEFGGVVLIWRGSAGVGACTKTNISGAAPSLAITTTGANSALSCSNTDWNAVDGTSTRVWRTVNSITPTAGNGLEKIFDFLSGKYTTYAAIWNDAGAAGAKTVGLSAPSAQKYSIIALEILAAASGSALPPATCIRVAQFRSSLY